MDFGDGSFSTNTSTNHAYIKGGNYTAKLVAQADNNCLTDTVSKPIKIDETHAYAGRDTLVLADYPYQLQGSGGDFYKWAPSAGLDNAFIANPVAKLSNNQTYILTATTAIGCATKDTLNIKVANGPRIYVPTAFTPNADGLNDKFKILPVGVTQINSFVIYNRWGQVLYSSANVSDGWNGNFNGVPQPAGTYIWTVSGISIDGKTLKRKGTVVLIR